MLGMPRPSSAIDAAVHAAEISLLRKGAEIQRVAVWVHNVSFNAVLEQSLARYAGSAARSA